MAKILVADDNSNIQKMVGLALKDQGIDVVAVGNGEAAVRKIVDVRPDLVLADVFMPVRNGYEVCKYVKENSELAHIPVILLVGAFDPLDEQEAQRVGADGVLKKPFVPPDPLISMVKSALSRAGVRMNGSGGAKPGQAEPWGPAATVISPNRTEEPRKERGVPSVSATPVEPEPVPEELLPRPKPLTIEPGKEPVAFGSLLETPTAPEPEEDLSYTTPSTSELLDRDWHAQEKDEEEQEEETGTGSWRRDGGEGAFETADTLRPQDWHEPPRDENLVSSGIGVTPLPEIQHPTDAPLVREPAPAATPEAETEEPVQLPPTAQESSFSTAPAAVSPGTDSAGAPANLWFTNMSSPWDAEARKSTDAVSAWDAPVTPAVSEPLAPATPAAPVEPAVEEPPLSFRQASSYETTSATEAPVMEPEVPAPASTANLPPSTVETIREETSHFIEQIQPPRQEPAMPSREESAALTEELVAKVLARMSPEVLQAVTREILRPIVEAVVRDELKKKS